jgi:hypothetical protein
MISALIRRYKRILRNIRSGIILNRMGLGKTVYFENPLEEIAIRYIPGDKGRQGIYFAKHYGRDEYEIEPDSSCILMGVMEGKPITRSRYNRYHLIEGVYWTRKIQTQVTEKVFDKSYVA